MFSFTLTLQHVDRLTGKVFCSAVNSEHPDSDHQQWLPLPRRGLVPAVHHAVVMNDNWHACSVCTEPCLDDGSRD